MSTANRETSQCGYSETSDCGGLGNGCQYCYTLARNPPKTRPPLPGSKNLDGRPVWEAPIFNYSQWIKGEHDKKSEVVLKYFRGNRAWTTKFMDLDTEWDTMLMYKDWLDESGDAAQEEGDVQGRSWFEALSTEVRIDIDAVENEYFYQPIYLKEGKNVNWRARKDSDPDSNDDVEISVKENDSGDSAASVEAPISSNVQESSLEGSWSIHPPHTRPKRCS